MVFGIVHQVCSVVPGHDVAWVIAVPHQHATLEHFAQTGAAVHPALFNHCARNNEHSKLAAGRGTPWKEPR
jgi:hypothetical protein